MSQTLQENCRDSRKRIRQAAILFVPAIRAPALPSVLDFMSLGNKEDKMQRAVVTVGGTNDFLDGGWGLNDRK